MPPVEDMVEEMAENMSADPGTAGADARQVRSMAEVVARNREATSDVYDMVRHLHLLVEWNERLLTQSAAVMTATRRRREELRHLGIEVSPDRAGRPS